MLVVVDVGNTTIAFGAFDGDRLIATERVEAGQALIGNVIPFPFLHAADRVVVASSSPPRLDAVLAALGRPAEVLGADAVAPFARGYGRPETLGLDRVAAVLGARHRCDGAAVVVADAGTCVTVDGATASGAFVPVAIAPGLPVALQGLRAAAPHLPPPPVLPGPVRVPARSSQESLRAGFVLGLAGLVERLLDEAAVAVGGEPLRVLTGGSAPVLSPHVSPRVLTLPDALLHGLRVLAEHGGTT